MPKNNLLANRSHFKPRAPEPTLPFTGLWRSALRYSALSFQIWFFPPIWGEKMAAFWACACKLSWTLLSPARVQPLYGAGRKESSGTGLGPLGSSTGPSFSGWTAEYLHRYLEAWHWLMLVRSLLQATRQATTCGSRGDTVWLIDRDGSRNYYR